MAPRSCGVARAPIATSSRSYGQRTPDVVTIARSGPRTAPSASCTSVTSSSAAKRSSGMLHARAPPNDSSTDSGRYENTRLGASRSMATSFSVT